MSTFQDHFADHAASSFARQIALGDVIGERPWGIDMQKGLLRFGDDLEYPVQLLGTHAFEPRTWLWVWANTQSNLPPQITEAALRIRQLGEAQTVEAFTQPSLQLDDITDHMIAMTCTGLEGGRCYYRAPYDGGALFVLLDDVPAEVLAPVSLPRVNTVLMGVISQFDVDHRRMVTSFLRQQGLHAVFNGTGVIRAERAGEGHIEISFDELGRISNVAATLGPVASAPSTQAAPKKPRWQFWK
ncbi:DUF6882 domain-containing protein [Variovorax boronicumulans]|uniref:DUF6882 domain-containing protein n=1 Tax=Variovorax boronicumulans TaxID=436515 RepID=UPI00358EB50B